MERYLYVFRGGDGMGKTPEEIQAHMGRWGEWMGKLKEQGKLSVDYQSRKRDQF